MNWIIQFAPQFLRDRTKSDSVNPRCAKCNLSLVGVYYFRQTMNPDSPDAEGIDVCLRCSKSFNPPPPTLKEALTT